jgi:phage baseplate assembly protein W
MSHIRIPHFPVPFHFEPFVALDGSVGRRAAEVEQDTYDEIFFCAEAVVRYPTGHREEKPEFGTPDQVFKQGGPDTAEIRRTITRWEPRTEVTSNAHMLESDELTWHVSNRIASTVQSAEVGEE